MTKSPKKQPSAEQPPAESTDQLAELEDSLKRTQADFINYRRRSETERGEVMALATESVIAVLLPILDNFRRAADHRPPDLAGNEWADGVAKIEQGMEQAFEKLGVKRYNSLGQPFDPTRHEAIGSVEGDGPEDTVAEELQA